MGSSRIRYRQHPLYYPSLWSCATVSTPLFLQPPLPYFVLYKRKGRHQKIAPLFSCPICLLVRLGLGELEEFLLSQTAMFHSYLQRKHSLPVHIGVGLCATFCAAFCAALPPFISHLHLIGHISSLLSSVQTDLFYQLTSNLGQPTNNRHLPIICPNIVQELQNIIRNISSLLVLAVQDDGMASIVIPNVRTFYATFSLIQSQARMKIVKVANEDNIRLRQIDIVTATLQKIAVDPSLVIAGTPLQILLVYALHLDVISGLILILNVNIKADSMRTECI